MPSPRQRTTTAAARGCRRAVLAVAVVTTALVAVLAAPSLGVTAIDGAQVTAQVSQATTHSATSSAVTGTDAPDVDGTFEVATTSVTLVDTSRSTPARGTTPASSSRALTVTVTYPELHGLRATFPLVMFVHGYETDAATYADLTAEIAARGFVVAAPDFPLSSSALDGASVRDVVEQATDVSFVISSLLDPGVQPAELHGLVAASPVAVIGHSDGGITAAGVAFADGYADARIGSAVVLSGAEAFFPGDWFGAANAPALLAIHGTADEVNPFGASRTLYEDADGTKMLVAVDGGSHLGPFTTDTVRPAIATLIADFLRAHLSGDPEAGARVAADASTPGLELVAAA